MTIRTSRKQSQPCT